MKKKKNGAHAAKRSFVQEIGKKCALIELPWRWFDRYTVKEKKRRKDNFGHLCRLPTNGFRFSKSSTIHWLKKNRCHLKKTKVHVKFKIGPWTKGVCGKSQRDRHERCQPHAAPTALTNRSEKPVFGQGLNSVVLHYPSKTLSFIILDPSSRSNLGPLDLEKEVTIFELAQGLVGEVTVSDRMVGWLGENWKGQRQAGE